MANRLSRETSPYLLQHAGNPVDWYAWGDEAFTTARDTGKPILLSVGYSACHWCHVMAHESFENPDIAAKMNELVPTIWPPASTASSTYLPASSPASANCPLPVVDVVPAIRPVSKLRARTTVLGNRWPAAVTTVPLMATGAEFCTAVFTGLVRVAPVACAACNGMADAKAAIVNTAVRQFM